MEHDHRIAAGPHGIRIKTHDKWGITLAVKGMRGEEVEIRLSKDAAENVGNAIIAVAKDAKPQPEWMQ